MREGYMPWLNGLYVKIEDLVAHYKIKEGPPAPVEGKEWCEHMEFYDHVNHLKSGWGYKSAFVNAWVDTCKNWKVCPHCAAPRPAKESLEEKLAHEAKTFLCKETTDKLEYYRTFEKLAEIARKFYEKKS